MGKWILWIIVFGAFLNYLKDPQQFIEDYSSESTSKQEEVSQVLAECKQHYSDRDCTGMLRNNGYNVPEPEGPFTGLGPYESMNQVTAPIADLIQRNSINNLTQWAFE